MTQDILNNLKPGEQIVDIQEYFHGEKGKDIVYQVTIYSCKKILFFKKVKKYTIPFFFNSKELAEEFVKYLRIFKIVKQHYNWQKYDRFILQFKDKTIKTKYTYYFCNEYANHTNPGDIWKGTINCASSNPQILLYSIYNVDYKEVLEIEKENTFGKSFIYKLCE